MSMRKRLLFLFIPVSLLTNAGHAQDKWDLQRCVNYAVEHNISVRQSDVQARLAKLNLDQSRLTQIPSLSFASNFEVEAGRSQNPNSYSLNTQTSLYNTLALQSGITVFNGFNIRRTIQSYEYAWQAALAGTERTKNDISLNVANAYLQVLLATQTSSAAELQLKLSQNQLDLTRKQVQAGTLPELNSAELESQVAQDSSTYITSKGNEIQAVLTLKAYMDLDAAVPFEVDTPPVDEIPIEQLADLQPDAVYTLALTHQPLQKMDALQIRSYQEAVLAAKGAMYPTVSLFAGIGANWINTPPEIPVANGSLDTIAQDYITKAPIVTPHYVYVKGTPITYFNQLNNSFGQSVGLSLNIPIFNQGTLRTNYNRSKLNLLNQELQRDQDNLTLKSNIYQAYSLSVAALEKYEANKITVDATQKSYLYAKKRYDVGMLNTIDLLTNQNNYFNAKVNLISSHIDFVFKMKVLEYYKGMGIRLTK